MLLRPYLHQEPTIVLALWVKLHQSLRQFDHKIYKNLPFKRQPRPITYVVLTQLNCPLHHSTKHIWLMQCAVDDLSRQLFDELESMGEAFWQQFAMLRLFILLGNSVPLHLT